MGGSRTKLLADLKEAHDRLNQAPDNSSRPPSSRAPRYRANPHTHDDREGDDGEAVRQAELVYADETGWKEHGRPLWLWVFTCATASLFAVGRRTQVVVQRVLGEQFANWLMSDGIGPTAITIGA